MTVLASNASSPSRTHSQPVGGTSSAKSQKQSHPEGFDQGNSPYGDTEHSVGGARLPILPQGGHSIRAVTNRNEGARPGSLTSNPGVLNRA